MRMSSWRVCRRSIMKTEIACMAAGGAPKGAGGGSSGHHTRAAAAWNRMTTHEMLSALPRRNASSVSCRAASFTFFWSRTMSAASCTSGHLCSSDLRATHPCTMHTHTAQPCGTTGRTPCATDVRHCGSGRPCAREPPGVRGGRIPQELQHTLLDTTSHRPSLARMMLSSPASRWSWRTSGHAMT